MASQYCGAKIAIYIEWLSGQIPTTYRPVQHPSQPVEVWSRSTAIKRTPNGALILATIP